MSHNAKYAKRLRKQQEKLERERKKLLAKERQLAEQQRQTVKKWRERDKQMLYERVRERYLQLIRLRLNVVSVEPMRKMLQIQERLTKRRDTIQRQEEKKRSRKLL